MGKKYENEKNFDRHGSTHVVCSTPPTLLGQGENTTVLKERKTYTESRAIIPIYTEHGLEKVLNPKGKPPANYVTIIYPNDGATIDGIIDIMIESITNPTITIDGIQVGSGLSYT